MNNDGMVMIPPATPKLMLVVTVVGRYFGKLTTNISVVVNARGQNIYMSSKKVSQVDTPKGQVVPFIVGSPHSSSSTFSQVSRGSIISWATEIMGNPSTNQEPSFKHHLSFL